MESSWDNFWQDLNGIRLSVSRTRAIHINAQSLRHSAATAVQDYFRLVRPELTKINISSDLLDSMDGSMQELLRLSQGRNPKNLYMKALNSVRDIRADLTTQRDINIGKSSETVFLSASESQIVSTLESMLPSSASSYRQVLNDLQDLHRISWRGTAAELREVMREVLDHLAPDNSVASAPGFSYEAGQTTPTMKQKATFILKSRQMPKALIKGPQDLTDLIDTTTASLVRSTYVRGSVASHISPQKDEVIRLKRYTDNVLMELLEIGSS